jgi:deoxyhypusine monooxygenase
MTMNEHSPIEASDLDGIVVSLRKDLTSEHVPLTTRFRALFSLKHLASQRPRNQQSADAIRAIAAAFISPSALLKHELAYCLGQTGNPDAGPFLRQVLEDLKQDDMCRHEAAEALGALGDASVIDLLRRIKKDNNEPTVVRETCDIALDRIMWEKSDAAANESLKKRSDFTHIPSVHYTTD